MKIKPIPNNILIIQFLMNQLFLGIFLIYLFNDCNKKFVILYYVINTFTIFYYQIFKTKYLNEDPLLQQYNFWDIDGWSITHFLFNLLLGYHCGLNKQNIILIFTGGVLWEIFEHIYGKNNATFISYFTDSHEKDYWWYGKISDIVVNNLGLFLGILFKKFNLQYIIYKLNGRISKI